MSYVIRTHDGRTLAIKQKDDTKVQELARRLELTAVELVSGEIVYLSKGTVARIEKGNMNFPTVDPDHRIEPPDYRGRTSPELDKIKDSIRKNLKNVSKSDNN